MISEYILVLLLTYMEYFMLWIAFENKSELIVWDNIKYWLKYPPFICFFFFIIDNWIVATMIYVTFSYPYLLILYCMKNVNRDVFGQNKIIINTYPNVNKNKKWIFS